MALKSFDLTGTVALLTGGNGGIGLGMAEGLAQAGADIVIWGRDADKNAAAEAKLKAHGVRIMSRQVDVSVEAEVAAGMTEAVEAMGRLDTVVANAGVSGGAPSFVDYPTETWRRCMGINLDGVFFTFREACKHMVARAKAGDPGGSLVAVSSTAAIHGAARGEAYSASKSAVNGLVRAVAVEHARYGIRANAILPGWTISEMTGPLQASQKFNDQVIGRVPSRQWMEPEDFAGIAVYLASKASRLHTGDSIVIDAGYTIY